MNDQQIDSQELLRRNAKYVPTHKPISRFNPQQSSGTQKRPIIVSCIDHRVIPEQFLGIDREVPILRNAGGRAKEAIFDIAVLDTIIDVTEIVVIHHQNCGLTLINDNHVKEVLGGRDEAELKKHDLQGFCFTDDTIAESVREDVKFLRNHPWVRKDTKVTGFWYEIDTGALKTVEA